MEQKSDIKSLIDVDALNAVISENADVSVYYTEVADKTAAYYTQELDSLMSELYDVVISNQDTTDMTLEKYFMKLSNTIYFVGEQIEVAGISNDIADAKFKEVYNRAYLDAAGQKDEKSKSIRTVDENKSIALETAKYENAVSNIQQRAYELVKYKVQAAQTMIGTLSKMISKRISDASLTLTTSRGVTE